MKTEKSCETCKKLIEGQICHRNSKDECLDYNYSYYEPKEKPMSLFEKNLEVLKQWNRKFDDESNVQIYYQFLEEWQGIEKTSKFNITVERELRLKPQPTYRAYKPEEITDDFIGKIVRFKGIKSGWQISGYVNNAIHIGIMVYSLENAYKEFTWQDGTPFGIKEDL